MVRLKDTLCCMFYVAPEIDSANEALADSFAEELAIYNQCAAGEEPHSNTCFFVAEDCVVRCRAAIEHNDVGLRMWEAGLFLTGNAWAARMNCLELLDVER